MFIFLLVNWMLGNLIIILFQDFLEDYANYNINLFTLVFFYSVIWELLFIYAIINYIKSKK